MDEGGSSGNVLRNVKNFFGKLRGDKVTEEEIISMVNEGHESGVLDADEAEMIHNIFEYGDKEADEIMTHRKNIVALEGSSVLKEALDFILEQNHSRFPVYEGSLDNIIGTVNLKDAVKCNMQEENQQLPIKEVEGLLRPARFIPETRNISDLLKNMQKLKAHMVIVVDEYGQTAGLVTMEDILEEIVGNIQDEYDAEEESIIRQPDGSWLMLGTAPLEEVEECLGVEFGEEEIETLNGLLTFILDRIPSENEDIRVEREGYLFQVLEVRNKIIYKVRVTRLAPQEPDAEKQ